MTPLVSSSPSARWVTGTLVVSAWLATIAATAATPPASLTYTLSYAAAGDSRVHVSLAADTPLAGPRSLVMPRNYPGGYSVVLYDAFVENVRASSEIGGTVTVARDLDGPRWTIGKRGDAISRIEYDVDVVRMEHDVLSAVETSKVRPRYLGLLGYSVFAFVDGLEATPIDLRATVPRAWPVLSTLAPSVPAPTGTIATSATDYYALADSEILAGPDMQAMKFDGTIPLFVAAYVEGAEDLAEDGQLARTALDRVHAYFGDTPITRYTVHLELLKPLPGHDYGFSQEHLDSGHLQPGRDRGFPPLNGRGGSHDALMNYAHHMAHSWIPKRAYGEGYCRSPGNCRPSSTPSGSTRDSDDTPRS